VKVRVLPLELTTAWVGDTTIVPRPSLPTFTTGWVAMFVSVPVAVDASWSVNVYGPGVDGAVSPELKPLIP